MSSRVEELLAAAVDGSGTDGLDPPQSRNEKLLFALNDKLDNVQSELTGKVDVPADGQAYQQLVTDADGNTKWEDRLAYEGTNWKDFVLDPSTTFPTEITGFTMPPAGDTVRIKVNGVESVETVVSYSLNTSQGRYIGSHMPPSVAAGAPGWCVFCLDGEEEVHGRTNVPMTISLLLPEVHKIDQKYVPKEVYFVKYDGRSLDKTFDEITESYNAGMLVILEGGGNYGFLKHIDPEELWFLIHNGGSSARLCLTANNTIDIELFRYLTTADNGTLVNTLILPSYTSGSSKKFKITVDDTGTISATEVT